MRFDALAGQRVAIWGAGREGRAAWTALRARLPEQSVTWLCRPEEAVELTRLADARTHVHAGEVDADTLARFDYVIKSPGISPYIEAVRAAQARGMRLTSGTALWFGEHVGARTIAVTGTKGKSTTSALIAHLLRAAGKRVALCGNIGLPLLEMLDPPVAPEWWVIEMSSFQTRELDAWPEIAVVLNLFPEHLDWHGDLARYYDDKLRLLGDGEQRPRVAVLNVEQPELHGRVPEAITRWFGGTVGFHLEGARIVRDRDTVIELHRIPLPGRHNAVNLCAALTAIEAAGHDPMALVGQVAHFRPLPHRLQVLGECDGLIWVNDSIATTPHASLAALAHFRANTVTVLVGGHDRGLSWRAFREALAAQPIHAVVTMGANGARIAEELNALPRELTRVASTRNLDEAVAVAREVTPPGGVVLLSPGAPSFGEFRDYTERGRRFAELAGFDPASIAHIEGMGV